MSIRFKFYHFPEYKTERILNITHDWWKFQQVKPVKQLCIDVVLPGMMKSAGHLDPSVPSEIRNIFAQLEVSRGPNIISNLIRKYFGMVRFLARIETGWPTCFWGIYYRSKRFSPFSKRLFDGVPTLFSIYITFYLTPEGPMAVWTPFSLSR